jgi:hypothetical protein
VYGKGVTAELSNTSVSNTFPGHPAARSALAGAASSGGVGNRSILNTTTASADAALIGVVVMRSIKGCCAKAAKLPARAKPAAVMMSPVTPGPQRVPCRVLISSAGLLLVPGSGKTSHARAGRRG